MPTDITLLDFIALCFFFIAWYSTTIFCHHFKSTEKTLNGISKSYRNQWMLHLLGRESRMPDVALLGSLMRNVAFFASTSLLILASLIAVFGTIDEAIKIVDGIPYAQHVSASFWKLKLLLLIIIFVFIFFKLIWSIRQYNSTVIMIGAAPDTFDSDAELFVYANNLGIVLNRAAMHFVEGMRGFEYALAILAWFIHPATFILTSITVSIVIYRREFASRMLKAMID